METAIAISSIASPILIAIITGLFGIRQVKVDKQIELQNKQAISRSDLRRKESLLSMRMASANTKLTIGVAMALKNGHANGEIEEGMKAVEDAEREYSDFLKSVAINDITI